jgi:hypothetical protein
MAETMLEVQDLAMRSLALQRFGPALGLPFDDATKRANVMLKPKAAAQRVVAEVRGENSLEFISLWRSGGRNQWSRQNTPLAKRGADVILGDGETRRMRCVPVEMDYSIWVWSRDMVKAQAALRQFLLWQTDVPLVGIDIDVGGQTIGDVQLYLRTKDFTDESTVDEQFDKGVIHCVRMDLSLDGWEMDIHNDEGSVIETIQLGMYSYTEDGRRGANIDQATISS